MRSNVAWGARPLFEHRFLALKRLTPGPFSFIHERGRYVWMMRGGSARQTPFIHSPDEFTWGAGLMQPAGEIVDRANVQAAAPVTVGWFVRRTFIGFAILFVSVGGMAWLMHASIDPTVETEPIVGPEPVSLSQVVAKP